MIFRQIRSTVSPGATLPGTNCTVKGLGKRHGEPAFVSPSTVRQRENHLRAHILPRFGDEALHALGVPTLQMFATDLRKNVSQKTVVHVLITISGILKYAEKSGMRTSKVSLADLHMGTSGASADRPFFTRQQVQRIITAAREPYRTMFAVA